MTDHKNDQPYLLDDDDYLKLMEASYKQAGSPLDEMRAQKTWAKLSAITEAPVSQMAKKSRRVLVIGSLMGVAAGFLLLVRLQPGDQVAGDLSVKGVAATDYRTFWSPKDGEGEKSVITRAEAPRFRLRVEAAKPLTFGIYGTSVADPRPRHVAGPSSIEPGKVQDVMVSVESLGAMDRLCVIAAENVESFENTVALLDNVWQMLNTPQCVRIEP